MTGNNLTGTRPLAGRPETLLQGSGILVNNPIGTSSTPTESPRNRLFSLFEELMGKEPADTMMNLLPPVGWGDVASKRDLDTATDRLDRKIDHLEERVNLRFESMEQRFDAIDQRFDRVDQRFDKLDDKLDVLEGMRSDIQRTFVTWMFASQAAVIAALGVILTFVH